VGLEPTTTEQLLPAAVQFPQVMDVEPAPSVAFSTTLLPTVNRAPQTADGQLIPAGTLTTVPDPVKLTVTEL
jgi:hypothetical protein